MQQSYGVVESSLPELSIPFTRATEALWRSEREHDTLLNIAAILMFSLCCHTTDCGVTVAELVLDGRRMAERLGLFATPESAMLNENFGAPSGEEKTSTTDVARGTYGWIP